MVCEGGGAVRRGEVAPVTLEHGLGGREAEVGLGKAAIRGSAWTLGGYAIGQVLRLGGNLVLTRVLFPEAFGQMALVNIFLVGLAFFSDIGTGPAIVQGQRGEDPAFLDTAWTLQTLRGLGLWLASFIIARPVAALYRQPALAMLIPAAGLTAVMAGFEATAIHTEQRRLRLVGLTLLDLGSQAASLVTTLALAIGDRLLFGPNHPGAVWAIVGGSYAGGVTRLIVSHRGLPGLRHRFRIERSARQELFRFGRWIFVSTLLTFLAGQSDRLLLGRMIPLDLFGVYGIATLLAAVPTQAVQRLGTSVIFPAYSRLRGRSEFGRVFEAVRAPVLLAGGAAVCGLVAGGPLLIRLLYDSRYAQAGWMLEYLSAVAWFQILECTNGAALLALGRVGWVAAGSATKVAALAVLVPLGFHFGGVEGALVGLTLAEAAKYATSAVATRRCGLGGAGVSLALTGVVAMVAAAGALSGAWVSAWGTSRLLGLLAACSVSVAPWAAMAIVAWARTRSRARAQRAGQPGWAGLGAP